MSVLWENRESRMKMNVKGIGAKMGWSENRPYLFWFDFVIKFLCPYFLATIENGTFWGKN